ncbi:cupin domain-containing protein [Amycolatopsis sp. NPDC005232]|uniref:cupin domain-containing protein n=1 Tax=Amycolatopsis sp. NPDC005232 TaxID=3157027 RepID=UPI0033A51A72
MNYVLNPSDIAWHRLEKPGFPGIGFQFSESVVDDDYTSVYSVQLSKIGPGGKSKLHRDPYNHAFYVTAGTGSVRIGKDSWDVEPGSVVKIPAGLPHGFSNTGDVDLEFVVIYDPPYVAGTEPVKELES